VLEDARQFDVARGTVANVGTVRFGRDIRPDQFTLAKVDPDALTFSQLQAAISDLHDAGRPTAELEANLWHKLSGPLSALLMPILGSVAAFGLARSGQLFVRAVMGMALGFAYFVADNFSLAMGSLGAYPPFLAAWAPFFLFLLVGETVLFRTEE
jgi:lipopolysaccharide export system permease protein